MPNKLKVLDQYVTSLKKEVDILIRKRATLARLNVYTNLHELVCDSCKKIIDQGLEKEDYDHVSNNTELNYGC